MEAIQNLDSEHTLRLLRHQHPEQREALLNALPERISKGYRRLLHYAEHCVGAHMNPFIFVLATGTSVAEATQRVSQQDTHSQFFPFVVDHDQRLVGVLTVSDLIRASPKTRLEDIMRKDVVRLSAYATMDDVRKISGRGAFHSLPVLDVDGTLIGVIDQDGLKRLELGKYPVASEPPPFADGLALLGSAYFHVLSTFALQLTQPGPGTHGPHPESTQHAN